jgi:hypothetical protein
MEWLRWVKPVVAIAAAMGLGASNVMAEEIAIRCDLVQGNNAVLMTIDTEKRSAHLGTNDDSGWYFDKHDIGHGKSGDDDKKHDVDCRTRVQFVQIDNKAISLGVDYHYEQCAPDQRREPWHDVEWAINRITGIATFTGSSSEYRYQCAPFKNKAF